VKRRSAESADKISAHAPVILTSQSSLNRLFSSAEMSDLAHTNSSIIRRNYTWFNNSVINENTAVGVGYSAVCTAIDFTATKCNYVFLPRDAATLAQF